MKTIFIIFTVILTFQANANSRIDELFKEYYYNPVVVPRLCFQNISNFAKYLHENDAYDEDIRVIDFSAPGAAWTFYMLVPFMSRFGDDISGMSESRWYSHFIMILDNKVYDFSFKTEPTILPVDEYFEKMFIPKVQVMLFTPDFIVRGKGPYYTPEMARTVLYDEMRFLVREADQNGHFSERESSFKYNDFKKALP